MPLKPTATVLQHRAPDISPSLLPGQCAAFVTITTRHSAKHFTNPAIAALVSRVVEDTFPLLGIPVYAWCLMPDHLHLLIGNVTRADLPRLIYNFIRLTAGLAFRTHNIELWQWRYYRQIVESEEQINAISEYILENPRRCGIVDEKEKYPHKGVLQDIETI